MHLGQPVGRGEDRGCDDDDCRRHAPLAWLRQFAKLWGFALFCVLVVYLFREVALPFLFAILVAYILAPLVARFARCGSAARPFPRWLAVIILYVFILAGWRCSSATSSRSCRATSRASSGKRRSCSRRLNKEMAAQGGRLGRHALRPERGEIATPTTTRRAARRAERAARDRRRAAARRPLPHRSRRRRARGPAARATASYLIAPPALGRGVETLRRAASGSARSSSGSPNASSRPRARAGASLEYGQKFVGGVVVRHRPAVPGADGRGVHPRRSASASRRSCARWCPRRYQLDYDRIVAGIDRGLSGVIRGQLVICIINGVLTYVGLLALPREVPAAARRASRRR